MGKMPNIEIHGYGIKERGESDQLRWRIFSETANLSFAEDIVVTVVPDECVDRVGNSKPFLRIISHTPTKIAQLVKCLEPFGMDIETPKKFIPAKKA